MPPQRPRYGEEKIKKMAKFWPIVGVLGLRQVGKSTLLRDRLEIPNYLTFDDSELRREVEASPRVFLSKHQEGGPTVLDEVQKVPDLFDALKALVDRKKIPGLWYLSGSVAFSSKIGIRESLTGRIGLLHLYPMSLAEMHKKPKLALSSSTTTSAMGPFLEGQGSHGKHKPRFRYEDFAEQMEGGGLPVPAFVRDRRTRSEYWNNWIDTTLARDAAKAYGKGFDSEYCSGLVRMLAQALPNGDYPSLSNVVGDKRKAKRYIQALEAIFVLRRFTVHEKGAGNDHWVFGDSGLAYHLSTIKNGQKFSLSIARHYLLNEIFCFNEYQNQPLAKVYFKSERGSLIDLVWNNIPIKIIEESIAPNEIGYHQRALQGAMQKLGSTRAILAAPTNSVSYEQKGISLLPWTYWS